MQLSDIDLSDIDLTDMDRFQAAFPHEWFTFLRREAPVWFHPPTATEGNERGFWVVTKYEDVIAVSRDWQTFSSEKAPESETGGIMLPDIGPESGVGTMMLMMDPPQHTRYRKIVSSAFTPRVIIARAASGTSELVFAGSVSNSRPSFFTTFWSWSL